MLLQLTETQGTHLFIPGERKQFYFWLAPEGKRKLLEPMNGARLAVADLNSAGFAAFRSIQYPKGPVRVDSLGPASSICVRTKQGEHVAFEITVGERIAISHVVWEP